MIATCIYCGFKIEHGIRHGATRDDAHQALIDHDRQCQKNPVAQERDSLAAHQVDLVRELTSCQLVLHQLARGGEVTPEYADGAKAVLKRTKKASLDQHDALISADAWKKGFIAACVYAAGMLYRIDPVGAVEMLQSAVTEDELSLASTYDLQRLIESKASGDIPGLHRAWQAAKRREQSDGGAQ